MSITIVDGIYIKQCAHCQSNLPITQFTSNKGKPAGVGSYCRLCSASRARQARSKRKEMAQTQLPKNKRCPKCKYISSANNFHKDVTSHDGLFSYCKKCSLSRLQLYREKNSATMKDRYKRYYLSNKEQLLIMKRQHYQDNKEKYNKRSKEYYKNHKLQAQLYNKQYVSKNRGLINYLNNLRHKRIKQATPKWSNLKMIKEIYNQSVFIQQQTGIEHEVDHIIPISNRLVCGLHVPNNLRIITATENQKKTNNFIESLLESEETL